MQKTLNMTRGSRENIIFFSTMPIRMIFLSNSPLSVRNENEVGELGTGKLCESRLIAGIGSKRLKIFPDDGSSN